MRPVCLAVALLAVGTVFGQAPKAKDKPKGPAESYPTHPDSVEQAGVPKGVVTKYTWDDSKIFPKTKRSYWVYVPAQYKSDGPPACLMVFQDGGTYINKPLSVPTVFDNLIHKGEMPVTVAVFINPGDVQKDGQPNARPSNRSLEYDTLSDAYARFLLEEILPAVESQANVKLRTDAASRGIGGRSSGGICAFTVAWEKPGSFGKVHSAIGSFTNIRGGDVYPGKIRKAPKRDIRVFLQDGSNDLDNEHGNWWLANLQMEKALAFRGYDFKFVKGEGGHNSKHEAAILPDAMRWLWAGVK